MNFSKPEGFGKVLGVVFAITLIFVAGVITDRYVINSPGLAKSETVSEFGGVEGASYIIFKEGSTYYAKNGKTGAIEYSGTNARQIIDNAIDTLTNGGLVHIAEGEYIVTSTTMRVGFYVGILVNRTSIVLQGSGFDTVLKLGQANSRVITCHYADGVIIRDLKIDGDNKNVAPNSADGLIVFDGPNTNNGVVENVQIVNGYDADAIGTYQNEGFMFSKIVATYCSHGIVLTQSSRNQVYDCLVRHNDGVGLLIHGASWDNIVDSVIAYNNTQDGFQIAKFGGVCPARNTITNCKAYLNGWSGISLYSTVRNTMTDNQVFNNAGNGVLLSDDGVSPCIENVFVGIIGHDDQGSPTQDWGFEEWNSTDYTVVTSSIFRNNVEGGIKTLGANTKVNLCWNGTTWIP